MWRAIGVLLSAAMLMFATSRVYAADVFNACEKNTTHRVRASSILVNASPVCRSTETARTWNQGGPPGPPGTGMAVKDANDAFVGAFDWPAFAIRDVGRVIFTAVATGGFVEDG